MEAEHLNLNLQLGPHWSTGVFCAAQSHDIAFHIAEQEHQSIESGYHRYVYFFHSTDDIGREIVNDHCGE